MKLNRSLKLLIAGNSVIDLYFKGKDIQKRELHHRISLAFGGKYVVEEFYQFYGGGGANAAISLARQGFKVFLWSHLGNDIFASQIIKNLKKENVDTKLVRHNASSTPISAILLSPDGERTIITYRADADMLNFNHKIKQELSKTDWLVLFSLAKLSKKNKLTFLEYAKKNNNRIFLSLHGSEYLKGFSYLKDYFKLADIVHLNAHELADIFGADAKDLNFYKTNFSQKFKIPILLVTYDINGSFVYTPQKIYHQPIIKPKIIVDTTGAGDAFGSGFLGEYLKTDSIEKSLFFASKNACSIIEHLGAQNGLLYKKF